MRKWPKSHGRGDPAAPSPPHDADHEGHDYASRDHDHVVEPFFSGLPAEEEGGPPPRRSLIVRVLSRVVLFRRVVRRDQGPAE